MPREETQQGSKVEPLHLKEESKEETICLSTKETNQPENRRKSKDASEDGEDIRCGVHR